MTFWLWAMSEKSGVQTLQMQNDKMMEAFTGQEKGSHHGSMLFNTKLAKTVGYGRFYSKSGLLCEDRFLYDGMLQKGASYKHIPEGLLYYRRHLNNFNQMK